MQSKRKFSDSRSKKSRSGCREKSNFKAERDSNEERVEFVDSKQKAVRTTHGHNDIKWLIYNPNYANVVARIPFGKALGYPLDAKDYTITSGGVISSDESKWTIPGVATVRGLFTMGRSDDVNSALNVAALNEWIFLRHAGTGSLVDDPNDVAVYFIAIGQLLTYLGWLRRLCACLMAENPLNLYARKALVLTDDVDFEDLRKHQADLLMFTTWFATQVNNFIFPKYPYFEQAYAQFHYVYKDEELAGKAQYYKFCPEQFGILDETTYATGSAIVYGIASISGGTPSWNPTGMLDPNLNANVSYETVMQTGSLMLEALINSQFVATLGAAILKAHQESGLFRVADIDMLDERLDISMDAEIAMQFHNMQWYDKFDDGGTFTYQSVVPTIPSQQSPYLVSDSTFYIHSLIGAPSSGSSTIRPLINLLDCYSDDPTPAEVLLASRNLTAVDVYLNGGSIVSDIVAHDAFLPIKVDVAFYNYSGVIAYDAVPSNYSAFPSNATVTSGYLYAMGNLSTFTASPLLQYDTISYNKVIIGEFHNTSVLPVSTMKDIYRNNILSLFNVPKFK